MMRSLLNLLAGGVLLLLSGCCGDCNSTQASMPPAPVISDSGGIKHLFVSSKTGSLELLVYTWDTASSEWRTKKILKHSGYLNGSIYLDQNSPVQNFYVYDTFPNKHLTSVDLATGQYTQRQFSNNYNIITADEFVVYGGSLVKLHKLGTNVITSLHSLPSLSQVNTGLNLNIDITQYQMLCTPYQAYAWDYKTHYCVMANDIVYPGDPTPWRTNNFHIFTVSISASGVYTYVPLQINGSMEGSFVMEEQNVEKQEEALKRKPIYSSLVTGYTGERDDDFTIDSQGNLHLFYSLKDDSNIYYEYYTSTDPTTPLYVQVLP